jgi:beta-aspartyl-peptidase (threonine type)
MSAPESPGGPGAPATAIWPAIIVHGGAGRVAPERHEAALAGCRAAVAAGLAILAAGGSALDAAQAAVRVLEDDPEFNAGVGAVLTRDGTVELDAALMDGASLRIGAVAAVPDLRQPIDLARAVLDDGEHALLCGDGAWRFARERGLSPCRPELLITERSRLRLLAERERRYLSAKTSGTSDSKADVKPDARPDADVGPHGTVGACAVDAAGHVAAATSTGGINGKRPGRIGDTPLAGCGTYADDRGGAASATGDGEAIIRVTLTRQTVDRLAAGAPIASACSDSVADLVARTAGSAGVIACDRHGRLGAAHASETMSIAAGLLTADGPRVVARMQTPTGHDLHGELAARRGTD